MAHAADLSRFFETFPMRRVASAELDAALAEPAPERVSILFLWGRDCPNCDVAKRAMLTAPARFRWPEVRWFHDNVYDDLDMATRFGLHGIPVFILFRGKRQLGRVTGWPGADEFADAVARQVARTAPGA